MRTITKELYTFGELSESAKKKVVEDTRQWLTGEGFDSDQVTEDFKENLKERGLPTEKVYWRLSYCQGDGVGFYGKVDLKKFCAWKEIKLPKPTEAELEADEDLDEFARFEEYFGFTIEDIGGHYNHENSGKARCESYGHYPESWDKFADDLTETIQRAYYDTSRELYRYACDANEWWWKDENVLEYIHDGDDKEYYANGEEY